jgi:cytoskeletal protein RodZ
MSKQFIQFASVLFMLAALLAVSAQENTTALNNATMNNTTLLNNTTLNASVIEVPILPTETANETALNETVSAENESAPAASEIIPVQNETAPSQIEVIATQNETAPAQNTTQSENVTVVAEPVSTASLMPAISQPGVMQIGSPQKTAFAIGGIGRTPSLFPIDSKALSQDAYKVGLPAETIMDLSALPFFVNKM